MKKPMRTTSLFDIVSEVRGTKLTKIAQIDRVTDWAPVRAVIETVYTKGSAPTGRPSYDGLMLFKIDLLRVWYGLRDEGVEEMVNDRISFSRFVGLSLAAPVPDSPLARLAAAARQPEPARPRPLLPCRPPAARAANPSALGRPWWAHHHGRPPAARSCSAPERRMRG